MRSIIRGVAFAASLLVPVCGFASISGAPNPNTGSYTVSWTPYTANGGADDYVLYESTNGGSTWPNTYSNFGSTTSIAFSGKEPNTYTYKVHWCFDWELGGQTYTSCADTGYSQTSVTVNGGPAVPQNLTVPAFDLNGAFSVSWSSAAGATSYRLQRKRDVESTWTLAYSGAASSANVSGLVSGGHWFRVQACDGSECSAWTPFKSMKVDNIGTLYSEPSFASAAEVGSTPFQADIDRLGNGNVELPLRVPPGVNGLTPKLSLSFSSGASPALVDDQRAEGPLGYGWRVNGVPEIHRCRVGLGGTIAFDTSDRFCVDGEALILVSGSSYLADDAEYRTESQSFIKVVAKGFGISGRYFEARTADGRTLVFGDVATSRVVSGSASRPYKWSLTMEQDEFGNQALYTWIESTTLDVNVLTRITYDGTEVHFRYGERCLSVANCDTALVQNGENVPGITDQGLVLNRILTRVNGSWVTDYRLDSNYTNGYLRLERVQHCAYTEAGSGNRCMEPIVFNWRTLTIQDGSAAKILNVVDAVTNGFGDQTIFDYRVINGDGSGNHAYHVGASSFFGSYTEPPGVVKRPNLQRAIVNWIQAPDGKGGHTLKYQRYTDYPRYSNAGRGFLGFRSTRTDFRYQAVYDPSTDSTFNSRRLVDRQYRLDFPFIGREARRIVQIDVDGSSAYAWRQPERYEWGWAFQSMHGGAVKFPYLARAYTRTWELTSTLAHASQRGVEETYSYCFRALSSGSCPTSGTLLEYPTQLAVTKRTGTSLGSQNFGSTWGHVGTRTISGQIDIERTTADYQNHVSNWVLGFVAKLERGFGSTGISITETTNLTKAQANSLKVGQVVRFPGDASYQLTDSFAYDAYGNQTSRTTVGVNVSSRTTSTSSFVDNRYPQLLTDAENLSTSFGYDLRFGTPKTIEDPNGNLMSIVRDNFGRVVQEALPDGTTTSITYDGCSSGCSAVTWAVPRLKVTRTVENGSVQVAPTVERYFDAAGNLVLVAEEAFNSTSGWVRTQRHFDDDGNLVKESLPYFSLGGTPAYVEHHRDFKGRTVQIKRPDGSALNSTIVGSTGVVTVDSEETGTGVRKQSKFNALNQLTETTDGPGSVDAVTAEYLYTVRKDLDTVTVDGTQVADVQYDNAGYRSSITEPNSGTTAFTYDALGQLIQTTDAKSQKVRYTYDRIGRLTQRIDGYLGSNPTTNNWVWDAAANGQGLLASRTTDAGFAESYSYTAESKLDTATATVGVSGFNDNGNYVLNHNYDTLGRLASVNYPNLTISYVYTSRGHLSQVRKDVSILHRYDEADAFGNVTQETFANGVQTARAYDPNSGRLTSIETGNAATPKAVQDLLYQWRTNGTLLRRTDQRGTSSTGDDRAETFTYDALNRVKLADIPSGRTLTQSYNAHGNLLSKTSDVAGDLDVTGYGYTTAGKPHRLTSATIAGVANSFVYDANGSIVRYNAASGDDTFIDYDSANRATTITVGSSSTTSTPTARDEFWHDPEGQRFLRRATWMDGSLETAWTLYLWGGIFEEVHPEYDSSVAFRQRVQVSEAAVHQYEYQAGGSSSTATSYLHRDHLGSIDAITDGTGAHLRDLSFDPFGGRRADDWSSDIPAGGLEQVIADADVYTGRGFTDHEHLNRTGIIHMNGRIYDPRIGRFLRPDPIVAQPSRVEDLNRYSYAWNSPLSILDPSGFSEGIIEEVVVTAPRFRAHDSGSGSSGPGGMPSWPGLPQDPWGAGSWAGSGRLPDGSEVEVVRVVAKDLENAEDDIEWQLVGGAGASLVPFAGYDVNLTGVLLGSEFGDATVTASGGYGANVGAEVYVGVINGSIHESAINVDINIGAIGADLYFDVNWRFIGITVGAGVGAGAAIFWTEPLPIAGGRL